MKYLACLIATLILTASINTLRGEIPATTPAKQVVPATQSPALSVEALKNAEYRSEFAGEGKARLVDGTHVEKESPNSATELRMTLSDTIAQGDLNGDGVADAAVILVSNPGGSGTFYELVAVINQNGQPRHGASILLGDRVQVKQMTIKDGQITVRMVTQGPNDPMSTPTMEVTQKYKLEQGKLVPVEMTPATEQTLNQQYEQIYAECQPVRKDFANGRYNGTLLLDEVVAKLEATKKELAEVKTAYDRLVISQKTNPQIAMRFLTLGKMGFAALEAEIKMVREQMAKQKTEQP